MNQRSKDYMIRSKAKIALRHPADLKSFLIAEYNSSTNIIVKKDILKMIENMEASETVVMQNEIAVSS